MAQSLVLTEPLRDKVLQTKNNFDIEYYLIQLN